MSRKLKVRVGDRWYTVEVEDLGASPVRVLVDGELVQVDVGQVTSLRASSTPAGSPAAPPEVKRAPPTGRVFRSPMPGIIVSVEVKEGDQVVTGDKVCVLEAMKMQQALRAEWTGIVKAVYVRPGQQIAAGDPIIELE